MRRAARRRQSRLRGRARLVGKAGGRDAHVAHEGAAGLVRDAAHVGLPAEAADAARAAQRRPTRGWARRGSGPPAAACASALRLDLRLGNGFEQAHADELRRHARAHHHVRAPWARSCRLRNAVVRLAQRVGRAVGERARASCVKRIATSPSGFTPVTAALLNWSPYTGSGLGPAVLVGAGHRQAQQQRHRLVAGATAVRHRPAARRGRPARGSRRRSAR